MAADDAFTAPLTGAIGSLPVLENDSDADGDLAPSSVSVITQPANGTASALADGRIQVTMDAGFTGADQFTYQVCDSGGRCDSATVRLTIGR